MKKEYKNQDSEEGQLKEPEICYEKNLSTKYPCQYTIEEVIASIEKGMEEKKAGLGKSHEEMKKRFM